MRQAPKVILVGEMRDRETVELGLSAAETGHLVMSTLHTIDCGQTINRILGMFELSEQDQIRERLADTLRWVISQRLAPKSGGGRQALLEIMGNNVRTKESILQGESEGKTYAIPSVFNAWACWYDAKLFREHGWQVPKTWSEFEQLCDTISSAGIAPQFTATNALPARGESRCTSRAMSSLPVPVSPSTSTPRSLGATLRRSLKTSFIGWHEPMIAPWPDLCS